MISSLFDTIISSIHDKELLDEKVLSLVRNYLFGECINRNELLCDLNVRRKYLLLIKILKCEFKKYDYVLYMLVNSNGEFYLSELPGKIGGNRRLKIYGSLNCSSANKWISKGYYVKDRVFFESEDVAISAGYRPCAICMPNQYNNWKIIQKLKK